MTSRTQLMCFAAFTALTALSGLSRADESSTDPRADDSSTQTVTCEQAKQNAWFIQQLQLGEGGGLNTVELPVECQRELIAKDAEILAAIHASVAENE